MAACPVATTLEPSRSARWIYTDKVGAIFDPGPATTALPGSEPALLEGVRVLASAGVIEAWARTEERMSGFRRLPARWGGGYAIWSDSRTYRAESFLGELTALADISPSGGIRPWMGSLLLRTRSGVVLLDPATHAIRRAEAPGLADGVALDERHAVRLDRLGRASVTSDGGASWTDVLATRGLFVSSLDERDESVSLGSAVHVGAALSFDRQGHLGPLPVTPDLPSPSAARRAAASLLTFPESRRALATDAVAHAVVAGARLPGDRLLVAREGGLQILAGATALPIDDADLASVDEKLAHCQPITLGATTVLLACAGERGAEVLALSGSLRDPRLEAAFAEQGLFVAGPRGRLGFVGRCGALPPSPSALGPGSSPGPPRSDDGADGAQTAPGSSTEPTEPRIEASLPEDARYCARISADHWVERSLRGADARSLYRFVPGDEGRTTALLLAPRAGQEEEPSTAPRQPTSVSEGVRVIRLDPEDPALGGGAFPALPRRTTEVPYRTLDADYWEDDDGSIRGWVRLPALGEATLRSPPVEQGAAKRRLPVSPERRGRSAGVRIDKDGHIQVLPLPEGVTEVVAGGLFGLAQAEKDGVTITWETLDGGRTWTAIEGPPTGSLASSPDERAPFGCTALGCTWGTGIVRLGWGSPPPPPPSPPSPPRAAPSPGIDALLPPAKREVSCSIAADSALWMAEPTRSGRAAPAKAPPVKAPSVKAPPVRAPPPKGSRVKGPPPPPPGVPANPPASPISLRLGSTAWVGQLGARGSWSGEVWSPFEPAAAARHLAATDRSLTTSQGAVIPVLGASPRAPVDLLLSVGKRRLRVGAAPPAFLPFDVAARITVAADGPDGELVLLDPDKGIVWIARGDAVSAALQLGRVADVSSTRFTLGRRAPGGGLVLVGYSIVTGEVFAGDLDLARAEVGPLFALARIEALVDRGACAGQEGAIRFLADLDTRLTITGRGSGPVHSQGGLATFLIEATPERLCAVGVEVGFPRGQSADLTARFGRDAAQRGGSLISQPRCEVG